MKYEFTNIKIFTICQRILLLMFVVICLDALSIVLFVLELPVRYSQKTHHVLEANVVLSFISVHLISYTLRDDTYVTKMILDSGFLAH